MFAASKTDGSSELPDPQFNYVTMLLHGDGTNGAQNNTFLDSSTNNFSITRNGNTTQGSFSPYGSNWSNYFNGLGYLSIAYNSAFNYSSSIPFTIDLWFYPTVGGVDSAHIASCSNGVSDSNLNWLIRQKADNTLRFVTIMGGAIPNDSTNTFNLNQWNHAAIVMTGSAIKLWLNGVYQGSVSCNGSQQVNGYINIGYWQTNYTGYVSNFRYTNTQVYTGTSNITVPTAPLTAISGTQLLTCQSNSFKDSSANNFAITVPSGNTGVQRFNPFGSSTAYSASVIGGSGYFDGTGDYLSVANNTNIDVGTGAFTIEAWVYRQGGNSDWRVMGGSVAGSGFFGGRSGGLGLGRSNIAWDLESSTNVYFQDAWNHIVYVRDGSGNLSIFSNGVRVANTTGNSNNYGLNGGSLQIAAETGSQTWIGYMSNFRLVKGSAVYSPTATTLTVPTAPLTAVSGTGLLLYYTNGAIFDNAMINDLETVGNAQISTSVVKYGTGSLAFDGSGDWLLSTSSLNIGFRTGDFTVEFWINPTNWSATYAGVIAGILTNSLWIGKNASNFVLRSANNADLVSYGTMPTTGTWTHIAITRSGTTARMFYDGTQVASGTTSNDFVDAAFYIGQDGGSNAFIGYIDDMRITKGYARYTANFTPPTAAFPNTGPI